MNTIWRVSKYLFRYPRLFWLTMGLATLSTLLGIAVPWLIKDIIEGFEGANAASELWRGVVIIVLLYCGAEVFNSLRIMVNNTLEQRVLLDMRRDLHEKLLRLPFSFYDKRKSGEISSRVIEDVGHVEQALLDGTERGSQAILSIAGITLVLFLMNPLLAWLVFMPVPLLIIIGVYYSKGSRKVWKDVRESAGALNALLVEDIQGNRIIQTFSLGEREGRRFGGLARDLKRKTIKAMYRWAKYNPFTNFITNLGIVSVVAAGGWLMIAYPGSLTHGELVAFFIYASMLYQPLTQLHGINHLLAHGKASGDRVFEILDEPLDVEDPASPVPVPDGTIGVRFDNVSFSYSERAAVLENFTLDMDPGRITALVGHTGAGKTTVANLVLRSYDVTEGRVLINGVDVREVSLTELHDIIGHVAQDPFLFEGSVEDNLRLALPDATEEQMAEALRGAAAWDFVNSLPEGLKTSIGEKGIRLSQGEKQRITIARVLLKNPPMVILDEATASVDTITEMEIQTALENLMARRSVLVIAHRLSTVRRADKIVVLHHGRIAECGTHDELLALGGRYAKLWNTQNDVIPEML